MRNFKNTFVILLLLSLFSCGTQSISEDEAPRLDSRSSLKEEPKDPKDDKEKSVFTMKITVQYPQTWDRAATRAQIGPALGMTTWTNCSFRGDVETWTITLMTEAQFFAALSGFNVTTRSAQSSGTSDPYAKDPTEPVFYYAHLCQW